MGRVTGEARKHLAADVLAAYDSGKNIMQVAEQFGISYGKAHALIKEAGGTIRKRGTRAKKAD